MVRKILNNKIARYLVTGGGSYAIELAVLYTLVSGGTDKVVAVAISFWFGLLISFLLQKFFAFSNTQRTYKKILWQTASYTALVLVNYGFTIFFVSSFADTIGLFVARTLALIITTGWNFVIYSKVIFKKA